MTVETVTNINDLVISNPQAGDPVADGDNHIRNIKTALKNNLGSISGAVTADQADLNRCDVTTEGTAEASKVVTTDASLMVKSLKLAETCYFANAATPTKQLGVDVSGATSSTTMTLSSSQTASRTLTLPDATDTLMAVSTNQAVQADIEAETNQDTYIPPDLLHHHPGIAKAWVKFTDTGSNGAQTVDASYPSGVTVNRSSAGNYTITWNRTFSSAEYCVLATAEESSGPDTFVTIGNLTAIATAITVKDDAGTTVAPTSVHIMAFGDI